MDKPPFREDDENPRRRSDIELNVPVLGTLKASGPTVDRVMIIIVLLLAIGAHHWLQTEADKARAVAEERIQRLIADRQLENAVRFTAALEAIAMNQERVPGLLAVIGCVVSLNDVEKKMWRVEDRYCNNFASSLDIRGAIKAEARK